MTSNSFSQPFLLTQTHALAEFITPLSMLAFLWSCGWLYQRNPLCEYNSTAALLINVASRRMAKFTQWRQNLPFTRSVAVLTCTEVEILRPVVQALYEMGACSRTKAKQALSTMTEECPRTSEEEKHLHHFAAVSVYQIFCRKTIMSLPYRPMP